MISFSNVKNIYLAMAIWGRILEKWMFHCECWTLL